MGGFDSSPRPRTTKNDHSPSLDATLSTRDGSTWLAVGLALVLAVTGLSILAGGAQADHGSGALVVSTSETPNDGDHEFATIQAAIDFDGTNDDTIQVLPGLYEENVVVDASEDGLLLDAQTDDGSVANLTPPAPDAPGIVVDADDVTIQGFEIWQPDDEATYPQALRVEGDTQGVEVLNNSFDRASLSGTPSLRVFNGADSTLLRNNTVHFGAIGVGLGASTSTQVLDNHVNGSRDEGLWFLQNDPSASLTIQDNSVENHTMEGAFAAVKVHDEIASINGVTDPNEFRSTILEANDVDSAYLRWMSVRPGESIQTTIDDQDAGDAVLIYPGTYQQAIDVGRDSLTVRAVNGVSGEVTIDATDTDTTVAAVQASGVTLEDLSLVWSGSASENVVGVDVNAGQATLSGVSILVDGTTTEQIFGISAGGGAPGLTVSDSTIEADLVDQENQRFDVANGLYLAGDSSRVEGNTFTGWASNAVFLVGEDSPVLDNSFTQAGTAVLVCNTEDTRVEGNSITDVLTGIKLCGSGIADGPDEDPYAATIHRNTFSETNNATLHLDHRVEEVTVDARVNDWGVYEPELIQQRLTDNGENNEVLLVPFVGQNGDAEPGLPTNQRTGETYLSIQAAVDAAQADDTILLPGSSQSESPTPYSEAVTLDKQGLTLCATTDGSTCGVATEQAIVDATGVGTTVVSVDAQDATVSGLQLRWTGTPTDTGVRGVHVSQPGATITDNLIRVPGDFCSATSQACQSPSVAGVLASAEAEIAGNEIRAEPDVDDEFLGRWGVNAIAEGEVDVHDNTITGFGAGVIVWRDDVRVANNDFVANFRGVQLAGDQAEVEDNTFQGHDAAVYVAGQETFTPRDIVLRGNDMGLSNNVSLRFEADKTDAKVDARLNHWGLLQEQVINNTRVENGADNVALVHPYVDANGDQHPPRPEVRCSNADGDPIVAGTTMTLQRALDVPLTDLSPDCASDDRTVVLFEDVEEYDGAKVANPATIQSAAVVPARIQAQNGDPGLHFVDGSQGSTVSNVGVQGEPVGATGILVEDLGASDLRLSNVIVGSRDHQLSEGLVVEQSDDVFVSSSTFVSGDAPIELSHADDTTIQNSRILFRGPEASDARGIQVQSAEQPSFVRNTLVGNLGGSSVGIDLVDTFEANVEDNILANVATGVRLNQSLQASVHLNSYLVPALQQFGQDTDGIRVEDGGGHTVDGNTLQNAGTGILIDGAKGIDANLNEFDATRTGIEITDVSEDGLDAGDEFDLHNGSQAATLDPLVLTDSTANLNVDAECNDWGVYHRDVVRQRISDAGDGNAIDAQPFTSPNKDSQDVSCLTPPDAEFSFEDPTPDTPITRLDTVQFTDESEAGTYEITNREWNFDDGSTATGTSASHQFDDVRTYFVELTVRDRVNMTSSKVHKVKVRNLAPNFDDDIANRSVVHTENVAFDVSASDPEEDPLTLDAKLESSENGALASGMDFTDNGDGTGSFTWNPTAEQAGTYLLNLTVDDGFNTTHQLVEIEVTNAAPVFEPALPGAIGGLVNETLTIDVSAHDPDPGDSVTLSADLSELGENATFTSENGTGTLTWTPDEADAGETFNVTFTAESPARSTSSDVAINVREANEPPTIETFPDNPVAVDGTTAKITAQVTDGLSSDDLHDPVKWRVTTDPDVEGDVTTPDGNTITWSWQVPHNRTDPVDVTFYADDGFGEVSTTATLEVEAAPIVNPRLPREVETDLFTLEPVEGSTLELSFWALDADNELTRSDLAVYPHGDGTSVSPSSLDTEGLWATTVSYDDPGTKTVKFEATDADGHKTTQNLTFNVVENTAPEVNVTNTSIRKEATSPLGARVNLSADAIDPEGRVLGQDAFTWNLPSGVPGDDSLTGSNVTAILPVGDHTIELVVEDPFGLTTTQTVDVVIDDTISSTGELDAPKEEGYYRVRPTQESLQMLSGWVNVTDDQGLGTPGAHVSGVVNYYGTSLNSDNGVTTATFEDTTDANGVYEFSYEQEILGVQPTSLQASLLSAPGWHEIEISVTADSRTQAPVDDLETATETIQYYVGPAPAGPLG